METGSGFLFMRHGETEANRAGVRCGGESDSPLTQHGRRQAVRAGLALQRHGMKPGLIVSSPLQRTLATARLLNTRMSLETRVVSDLTERRLGAWNGQSVEATQPLLAAGATPPGGESNEAFRDRVLAAFRSFAPLYARWPLIVSSSGVARILKEHAGCRHAFGMPNGGVLRAVLSARDPFELDRLEPVALDPGTDPDQ